MAQAAQQESGTEGRFGSLGNRFDIMVDRPLGELSTACASAYVAGDRELPTASLFALICDPQVPPRLEMLEALHRMRLDGMLVPLGCGVVDWPLLGRRCFAIVYDRPVGGPVLPGEGRAGEPALITPMDRPRGPLQDDDLVHGILPPLAAALREILTAGGTQRAIRVVNLFYRDLSRRPGLLGA